MKGPAEKGAFGGGMPSQKGGAPSSFGKAPLKGPAEKGAFGGGMPPKAQAPGSSFGKAPMK
eukprot:scaffold18951_cov58-Skeletonema_marinoi.AAC.1